MFKHLFRSQKQQINRLNICASHTPCCGFHYKTYIGINPYHTLAAVGTAMYDSYVIRDLIL